MVRAPPPAITPNLVGDVAEAMTGLMPISHGFSRSECGLSTLASLNVSGDVSIKSAHRISAAGGLAMTRTSAARRTLSPAAHRRDPPDQLRG